MKESMRVSKTLAWNLLTEEERQLIKDKNTFGLHIHCPEAAQPKDGPSAGVAITIAILSVLKSKQIDNMVAITGEIDLNGNIHAIGGLESKLEGAKQAGIRKVLIPELNKEHFDKISYTIETEQFKVIRVSTIQDVIPHIFKDT